MKNQLINFASRKETFDKALNYYKSQGIVPQRQKLVALAKFEDGKGTFEFLFTKDDSLRLPVEKLLGKTDMFLAKAYGIGLMIETTATPGLAPIFSYPVLAGDHLPAELAGFENASAFGIYNGIMSMRTGSTVNQSRLPLIDSLYIPETQAVQIVNADGDGYVPAGIIPAFNIGNILTELTETFVLTGTKTQPFRIECPISDDWGIPADHTGYVALVLDGWMLETGATEEMKKAVNGVSNPFSSLI